MKKILLVWVAICCLGTLQAQDHQFGFGFYSDLQLKNSPPATFGIQGKYDFALHHGVQAQVYGRTDYVAVGGDYIYNFLDKTQHNWNVFAGAGYSSEFQRRQYRNEENLLLENYEHTSMLNAQVALSYYVPDVALSLYLGYKFKTDVEFDAQDPHFLMLGLRYHLW